MIFPLILAVLNVSLSSGLIMPMTKPDRSADISSSTNHVTLLEQMLTNIHSELSKQIQTTNIDVAVLTSKLSDQQKLTTDVTEELKAVKADLTSTTNELEATKNELSSVQGELTQLKAGATQSFSSPNTTVSDRIGSEVETNTREISILRSQVSAAIQGVFDTKSELLHLNTELANISSRYSSDLSATLHQFASLEAKVNIASSSHTLTQLSISNLDLRVKDVKNELDTLTSEHNSDKSTIRHQLTTLEAKVDQAVQSQNTSTQQLNIRLKATNQQLASVRGEFENTTETLKSLKSEINSASLCNGNETRQTSRVGYEVGLLNEQTLSEGATLKFDTVTVNDGNGYNITTGKFTAPVAGTYLFWVHMVVHGSPGKSGAYMYRNSNMVTRGTAVIMSTEFDTAMTTHLIHLETGDEVWFKHAYGSSPVYGLLYSGYGGVLLS